MKFCFYTNSISVHQLPLAKELAKRLGADNYRYIYTGNNLQGSSQEVPSGEPWIVKEDDSAVHLHLSPSPQECLESSDVLLVGGLRPIDLIERRFAKGLATFYYTERWFKPIPLKLPIPHFFTFHFYFLLPGFIRLLVPRYRRMASRFVKWLKSDPKARCLAVGPWAKRDMLWLGVPEEKIIDWGYVVEQGKGKSEKVKSAEDAALKVMWAGRPLWWKRVDSIRKAVAHVPNATLDVFTNISLAQVREEMRRHDAYVLASNELEGWGAVVNEALEEGMTVLGTHEAGASAALLPKENLFHAGDWRTLAKMLKEKTYVHSELPYEYSPHGAADKLMELMK